MSKNLYSLLLSLFLITIIIPSQAIAGRCSGDAYCTACTNCSACKHCSEEGGSCGVCANYEEPEPETEYTPIPTEQDPIIESEPDSYDSDLDDTNKEESSFGWIWWVVGIGGGLWFFGTLGKK